MKGEEGGTDSAEGKRQNYGSAKTDYFCLAAEMERWTRICESQCDPWMSLPVCVFVASYWRCWWGFDWSKVTVWIGAFSFQVEPGTHSDRKPVREIDMEIQKAALLNMTLLILVFYSFQKRETLPHLPHLCSIYSCFLCVTLILVDVLSLVVIFYLPSSFCCS